jgi:predicted AlkP superfamily pyrophosphatase or phosphodiesterase
MADPGLPRRVVYIVIDGMRTDAFEQACASGLAPALTYLKERSHYARDSVAAFPSITPCATATLITGATPDKHGIPGQCWYDFDEQRYVNYGQGPRLAFISKMKEVATDLFVNLNHKHLRKDVKTLHESLDELGFTTASTNFLVHRGTHRQNVHPDAIEKFFLEEHVAGRELLGPKEHYFADVISGPTAACQEHLGIKGKLKRVKATDEWASCVARQLLERDAADMVLFYLHENDHVSHHKGPHTQFENLVRAGELIGNVMQALGSWERTLDQVGFVLTADHGQTPLIKDDEHFIDLDDVLDDFRIVHAERGPDRFDGGEIAHAGNGRAGFVYLHPDRKDELRAPVIKTLLGHKGVDQVMWREDGWNVVGSHRGRLRFRPAERGGLVDERALRWEVEGELGAVDGVTGGDELRTAEYPLALFRIHHSLLLDRIGDVVVTSKVMSEIANIIDTKHKGEHGSLHAQDSEVPFLSTLADPPLHPGTLDVSPHILRHFERVAEQR